MYSLTLSENLPYGQQVSCHHHILKFCFKFFANAEVPNCKPHSHSGYSQLPLVIWTTWKCANTLFHTDKHTCDSNSLPIVGSLWSVFNYWLQLFTAVAKYPPAGGGRETMEKRPWTTTTAERNYCSYRQTEESREDIARKSSGVTFAELLFSYLSRWMWHISIYILSGNTESRTPR